MIQYILRFIPRSGSIMVDLHFKSEQAAEREHRNALSGAAGDKTFHCTDDFGQTVTVFNISEYAIQRTNTSIASAIQTALVQASQQAPLPKAEVYKWPGSSVQ